MVEQSKKSIADYYAGKSVFITGGTGFLGKVFIEKLLYSCPEIDNIYMLIREKKGITVTQRMKNFFEDILFERLKNKRPQDLEKLVPISGDIDCPNFGISNENEQILIEKVNITVHLAATVKFNEPLKVAWRTNVEGTRTALKLTQRMKHVEVFIHISTAFCNTNQKVLEEVLYPAPADIDEVYQRVQGDLTKEDALKIIEGRPNTYTFTKAIAEHLVAENQANMPTVIIRPSVVCPIKNEPVKGWVDNWFGATGLVAPTAKGFNRVLYGHENNIIDLIPADYVANLVVAAGAKNHRSKELSIYNCSSGGCNPVTLGKIVKAFSDDAVKHQNYRMPFPRCYIFTTHVWLMSIVTILFQIIPAYLADTFRRVTGKHPMYVKLQSRVIQIRQALQYFTSHSWIMKSDRTRELFASLSPSDKSLYPCDPITIDWNEYLRDYSWGVRHFLERRK